MKLYRRNTISQAAYTAEQAAWYGSLSAAQQAAVYMYTDYGYRSVNHNLRHGKALTAADADMVSHLDAALLTAPPAADPRDLYRAVTKLNFTPTVGETVTFPYFTSTSTDPHQLFKFVSKTQPILFEISSTLGAKISDIHPEFEFLLPRSTSFKVEEILTDVTWHAEYPDTDHSRAIHNATVIRMKQEEDHVPRGEARRDAR